MTINLHLPSHNTMLRPTITVVGVGGAGGNAVNNMIHARLEGVHFVIANTDSQALESAQTDRVIQLGTNVTKGLGAGADPEKGREAAEEAMEDISTQIQGSNMVFITAGMGGGTGTGAAPVVARLSREMGILTVGVVTKPFQFEGTNRMRIADEGLRELQKYVDTLIVIPNQNLFRVATERTTFADAFRMADEVLHSGVRGVTDLMVKPGLVNLDFADIRTVMQEMGKAMMGTGEATGEKRAIEAAEAAISNPLLDDVSLKGARAALINITGGSDMTLFEVDEAANRIREEIDPEANIIFGSAFNEELDGRMRVSVVATGIDAESAVGKEPMEAQSKTVPLRRPFSYAPAMTAAGGRTSPASGETASRAAEPVREQRVYVAPQPVPAPSAAKHAAPAMQATPVTQTYAPQPAPAMQPQEQPPVTGHYAPQPAEIHHQAASQPVSHGPLLSEDELALSYETVEETRREDAGPLFSPNKSSYAPPSMRQEPVAAQDEDADEEESISRGTPAFGFMNRIKEVSKALTARPEQEEPATSRARAVEVAERRRVEQPTAQQEPGYQESQLDIPAFLRRQAN